MIDALPRRRRGVQPRVACTCAVVTKDEIFVFGEYRLDVREHRLWRGDAVVALSPKTFDLLVVMLQGAGRLLEKDYLIRTVWPDSYVQDANLSVHIANIRKTLGKTSDVEQFIETVPRVGYRFVVPVSCLPDPEISLPATGTDADAPAVQEETHGAPVETSTRFVVMPATEQLPRRIPWRSVVLLSFLLLIPACALLLVFRFSAGRKNALPENQTTTRPLTSTPGLFLQPAFSPDGLQLAYTWSPDNVSHQHIYLQHVQSEDRRLLINMGGDDYSPAWSPDGSSIAFLHAAADDQPLEVFIADQRNSSVRRKIATICTPGNFFQSTPTLSWSPDGRALVTTDCAPQGESPSLILISVATGQKRQLTQVPPRTIDDQAAFSPDGTMIAFRRSQGDSSDQIYLLPSAGGALRRLTETPRPIDGLAWSGDGRRIIFSSGRATSLGNIWSLPLAGGPPAPVTTPLTHTSSPAVSAVGHRLAYVDSPHNVSVWRLALHNPGDAQPFITTNFFDASAVYSPDGDWVAFRSDRTGSNEIWICRSNGGDPKRITHFNGPMTGSPRWSPNGRSLAFDSRDGGRADIYVAALGSGNSVRITDSALTNSDNVVPAWSHDGRAIYYSSDRTGQWQIWRHSLDTGADVQITTSGGFNAMENSDGSSLFYVGNMDRTEIRRLSFATHTDAPLVSLGPGLWHTWTIFRDGIFCLRRPSSSTSTSLVRLDLRSGRTQTLGTATQIVNDSISVSPDGGWLLFGRQSNTNSSIMILDGWD